MSDDLISRDVVLNIIYEIKDDKNIPKNYGTLLDIINGIRKIQASFCKENVIRQLKELKMMYFLTIANTGDEKLDCAYENVGNALDKAIEIVEKGGIE